MRALSRRMRSRRPLETKPQSYPSDCVKQLLHQAMRAGARGARHARGPPIQIDSRADQVDGDVPPDVRDRELLPSTSIAVRAGVSRP